MEKQLENSVIASSSMGKTQDAFETAREYQFSFYFSSTSFSF